MKKLLVIAMVMVCGFLSSAEAQLPGNPLNPHGTLIDRPGVALAKWERVGTDLYWEFTLTTTNTFIPAPTGWYIPCLNFVASNSTSPPFELLPGSLQIVFDEYNYPYGTSYYSGIIDLTTYEEDWTTIQADYSFITAVDPNDPTNTSDISDTNFINNSEELGYPKGFTATSKIKLSNK